MAVFAIIRHLNHPRRPIARKVPPTSGAVDAMVPPSSVVAAKVTVVPEILTESAGCNPAGVPSGSTVTSASAVDVFAIQASTELIIELKSIDESPDANVPVTIILSPNTVGRWSNVTAIFIHLHFVV